VDNLRARGDRFSVSVFDVGYIEADLSITRNRSFRRTSREKREVKKCAFDPRKRAVMSAVPNVGCWLVVIAMELQAEPVAIEGDRPFQICDVQRYKDQPRHISRLPR